MFNKVVLEKKKKYVVPAICYRNRRNLFFSFFWEACSMHFMITGMKGGGEGGRGGGEE